MKKQLEIDFGALALILVGSLALASPMDAGDAGSMGEPASALLGFVAHPECSGEPIEIRVGQKTLRGHACHGRPDPSFLELFHDFGAFLEQLPVEKLERIAISNAWIDLDFAGKDEVEMTLHGKKSLALEPRDRRSPLDGGRLFRNEAEDFRLCLANVVRLKRDANGGIRGVREGDIEVKYGVWLDLELRTLKSPGRMATDAAGRILLAAGADGKPLQDEHGRYVPQLFDSWVVIEVDTAFKDIELSLGVPRSAASTASLP